MCFKASSKAGSNLIRSGHFARRLSEAAQSATTARSACQPTTTGIRHVSSSSSSRTKRPFAFSMTTALASPQRRDTYSETAEYSPRGTRMARELVMRLSDGDLAFVYLDLKRNDGRLAREESALRVTQSTSAEFPRCFSKAADELAGTAHQAQRKIRQRNARGNPLVQIILSRAGA